MNCPNCNCFCPDGTVSCPNCGTQLINNSPTSETVSPVVSTVTPTTTETAVPMPSPVTSEMPPAPLPSPITPSSLQVTSDVPVPSVNPTNLTNAPKKEKKPLPIKQIAIIGGSLVGVVILVVVINLVYKTFFLDTKLDYIKNVYDINQPITVLDDGKYGYINTKGKYIVKPTYALASQFQGDFAIVCMDKEGENCSVINRKGKEKLKINSLYSVEILDNGNLFVDDILYDTNFKQISPKNIEVITSDDGYFSFRSTDYKYIGFFNENGKITYKIKNPNGTGYTYLQVENDGVSNDFNEKYCRVNLDNEKYGIVNCETGKVVLDYISDKYISSKGNNIFEIMDKNYDNVESIFVHDNKIVYQGKDELYYSDGSKYITMYDDDYNKKYIDIKTGKIIDNPSNAYDDEDVSDWEIYTGNKIFSCSNGEGLMQDTDIKLDCTWDSIYFFSLDLYKFLESEGKEYVLTREKESTNLVNLKTGKVVTTFNARYIDEYTGSTFITYEDPNSDYHIYNLVTGKELTHDDGNEVKIGANFVIIDNGKTQTYYNADLKEIYTSDN